mgnify:CR=1 FL=1
MLLRKAYCSPFIWVAAAFVSNQRIYFATSCIVVSTTSIKSRIMPAALMAVWKRSGKEQQLAAVQPGDGQQVKHAKIYRDDSGQAEHIPPAIFDGFVDRIDYTDRTGKLIDAHTPGEKVQKSAQDDPRIIAEIPCRPMHHAARRFFNTIHPEIQYHGGCAVRIGSGIKLHLGQCDQLAVPQNRDGCGIISVRCSSYMTSSAVKQKCLLTDMISSFTCRPDAWLFGFSPWKS